MEILAYTIRCIFIFLMTWASIRLIGRKSVANMTPYDLSAVMLITTVAAEPLVYKVASKAAVGVAIITALTIGVGFLSLKDYFYSLDSSPIVLVSNGKVIKKQLKQAHMNIALLLAELRIQGYQNLSDVAYAILEHNGRLSVIPTSQSRPIQPSDININPSPVNLSFPIIVDGRLKESNLIFVKKNKNWLMKQLNEYGISKFEDVLLAQMDSSGNLYIDLKEKDINLPKLF